MAEFRNHTSFSQEQAMGIGTPERKLAEDKAHKAELDRKARDLTDPDEQRPENFGSSKR